MADIDRHVNAPDFEATPKQIELLEAVLSGDYKYIAFGGGVRGTKTWGSLAVLFILCRIFPGSRWGIVRQNLPTLRRNTIPSLEKFRPDPFVGPLNQSTWTYTCENGSQLLIIPESIASDPELEKWKGFEVNGFLLEESSELSERAYHKAVERAGTWIIPKTRENPDPVQPPIIILLTFNPCDNWPRRIFYEPWNAGTLKAPYKFIPATAIDNPFISEEQWESWKELPPEEYNRFIKGEWDYIENPHQLIKYEYILRAKNVEWKIGKRRRGVDVARYGDDFTVLCDMIGNGLGRMAEHKNMNPTQTGQLLLKDLVDPEMNLEAEDVVVDAVGLGAGTVDILRDAKMYVREFIAGAKEIVRTPKAIRTRGALIGIAEVDPHTFLRFKDLRSQAWWEAKEKLRTGLISLPENTPAKLIADLTSIRYKISGDRVVSVETKDELKAPDRLGRSTDYGDAFIQSVFDFPPMSRQATLPPTTSRILLR